MLVVVNSMPKSGSTWFHQYVVRCLTRIGHPDAHEALFERPITLNPRANPGALDGHNLAVLLEAARESTFAVKSHTPPNPEILEALRRDDARMVFLVRHPAEVVSSALAYGAACRAKGWDEPYAAFFHPREAADFVASSIGWAEAWFAAAPELVVQYSELFATDQQTRDTVHQLIPETARVSANILDELRPENLSRAERDWLRVNLVIHPELDDATIERCSAWASFLGYDRVPIKTGRVPSNRAPALELPTSV